MLSPQTFCPNFLDIFSHQAKFGLIQSGQERLNSQITVNALIIWGYP